MTFDSSESEGAIQRQVSDLVRAYLETVPKDEKPMAVEVAAEAPLVDPFTGEDLGIPLVGVIDLVLEQCGWPRYHGLQECGAQQRADGDQQ